MKSLKLVALLSALFILITGINPARAAAPVSGSLPTIAGPTALGENLIGTRGTWTGTVQTYSYVWLRCVDPNNLVTCVGIDGATSLTYKVVQQDVGKFLRLRVIAANADGSTISNSVATSQIVAPPINTGLPQVTGVLTVGSTLTSTNGVWSNPNQGIFRLQWYRCSSNLSTSCVAISGANLNTYVITDDDIASGLASEVRVFEATGRYFTTARSIVTSQVSSLPKNTTMPSITGVAATGSTLTANIGVWKSFPAATYTQQWQRCTSQTISTCQNIASQTALTYLTVAEDQNNFLRVAITALNSIGGTIKYSDVFGPIQQPSKPLNTVIPTLSGVGKEGNSLTVSNGTWTAFPPPTFAYKWFRCETESSCVEINGAIQSTFSLTYLDGNKLIKASVIATNSSGSTTASTQTLAVEAFYKTLIAPSIDGTLKAGKELIADEGTWIPAPDAALIFKWQICSNASPASCIDTIQTGQKLTINRSDVGKRFRVGVAVSGKSNYIYSPITSTVKTDTKVVKKGNPCKKLNSKAKTAKGKTLTCKRISGKLIWS